MKRGIRLVEDKTGLDRPNQLYSAFAVGIFWSHMIEGRYCPTYAPNEPKYSPNDPTFDVWDGEVPAKLLKDPSSVLPILDAWIRFFEVWEPQVEKDYL